MLRKEVVYNRSYICRNELCLLVSSIFLLCFGCDALIVECEYDIIARSSLLVSLLYILSLLDC